MEKTREILIAIFLILIFSPIISAEVIMTQPGEIYNLGDVITIPTTITTNSDANGFLKMFILCNGNENDFYKEYIILPSGEEKKITPSILLTSEILEQTSSNCKIKTEFLGEYFLTNEFKISNLINIEIKTTEKNFKPLEQINLEGEAKLETGKNADGIIEATILGLNKTFKETINNGYFLLNISLQENSPAGEYIISLKAYENDINNNLSNQGFSNYAITISQIPKNLEIVLENSEINPGENIKVKTILHDQTGENIPTTSIITIKNNKNKILTQTEKTTDEILEFSIEYNEQPSNWTIYAVSNKLTAETKITIKEKEAIELLLINKTLTIKNSGNIAYKKTILVKIGEEVINLDLNLGVDEEEKYNLQAPDGEYEIEIIADGESKLLENVALTGNAINIKQSGTTLSVIKHPIVWIFILLIFGFVAFLVLKKGYIRSFIGRKFSSTKEILKNSKTAPNELISENKAELSLSIKGDQQSSSVVCLKLKNKKDLLAKRDSIKETLNKITNLALEKKAVIYENNEYFFIILAPANTKTFKNEKTAVDIATKILEILEHNNKMFQTKIEFGISLNNGVIIAKREKDSFKFMSRGNFMSDAKKIATISEEEILLSPEINEKLRTELKTEKQKKNEIDFYIIKSIREKNQESEKFISNFIRRLEGKK